MSRLYVIGNGFDLWHDLPTSYSEFCKKECELLRDIEGYYSFDITHLEPWSDFENALGQFEWSDFFSFYNEIDVTSDSFKPSHVYGLEDEITEQADSHVSAIRNAFENWIYEIDISPIEAKIKFPEDSKFISFNYTSTLQTLYGVSNDSILHVHGKVEGHEDLIFGHGETIYEEPEIDEDGNSNRTMFSDAEGAAKYPFYAFRKPVDDILKKNSIFAAVISP